MTRQATTTGKFRNMGRSLRRLLFSSAFNGAECSNSNPVSELRLIWPAWRAYHLLRISLGDDVSSSFGTAQDDTERRRRVSFSNEGAEMSDERFDRIEVRLARVEVSVANLEQGQVKLEAGQARLETGLDEVRVHLIIVDKRLDKLEVSVEGMRDDIKQIAEGHAATQAAIERSTAAVIAHIDKRIDPLEEAVRAHFGTR
jgi:exonuclease VII small subunit